MTTETEEVVGVSGWTPVRLGKVARTRPLKGYKVFAKFGVEVPKDIREQAKNLPPAKAQRLLRTHGRYKFEGFSINLPEFVVFKAMHDHPFNTREAQVIYADSENIHMVSRDMEDLAKEGHFFIVLDFAPINPRSNMKGRDEPITVLEEIIRDKLSSPVGTTVRADEEKKARVWQKLVQGIKRIFGGKDKKQGRTIPRRGRKKRE